MSCRILANASRHALQRGAAPKQSEINAMTSHIKTASLLLFAVLPSACVWIGVPPDETTSDADASDDGATEPTTGAAKDMYVHFTCHNKSNFQAYPAGPYHFQLMHTCVSISDSEPWNSEANMTKILDACSATCAKTFGTPNNQCENDGWASAEPTYGEPLSSNCDPNLYGPEYGGEVLWLDGVQSPERQVTCDLNTDCGLMFSADVAENLQSKGPNSMADDDSAADKVSGLQLDVTIGSGRPLGLSGALEYSTSACGENACPFYLGRLDLEQTDSAFPLNVDLGALGRVDKSVSGLRVQLGKPTLGIALPDGQVAFPAGSLLLRIDAQLKGTSHALLDNGAETFWLRNPTAVVGQLVDGSLDLRMEVPTTFGAVKVETTQGRN